MRRPSPRAQPHTVTVGSNVQGTDQDGGRRVTSTTNRVLRCFVQPGRAQTIITSSDETGLRRVTESTPTAVYFVDDANLNVDDQLTWVDATGRSHVALVVGYYPPCNTNVFWHASCSETI